jgi:hypothetical protein
LWLSQCRVDLLGGIYIHTKFSPSLIPIPKKARPFSIDRALEFTWLPGTDSDRRPSGYKCPDISTRLGLSHHPSRILGARVSGASPPSFSRRVRAEALVSAPSLNSYGLGLGSGLPFSASSEGQASLNSPDFSTTISHGSCSFSYSHPLYQLSYRGVYE